MCKNNCIMQSSKCIYTVIRIRRSVGYESTIQLQLTPSVIPDSLRLILLRITIEGILFEKTFEADADIKFTYAWDRLNVYRYLIIYYIIELNIRIRII